MSKSDRLIVALLFLLLIGWGYFNRQQFQPAAPPASVATEPGAEVPAGEAPAGDLAAPVVAKPAELTAGVAAPAPVVANGASAPVPLLPEAIVTLENAVSSIRVSSHSGGILDTTLGAFRESLAKESPPVKLDFSDMPTLSLSGIPGLEAGNDFTVARGADALSLSIQRETDTGILFTRELRLVDDYRLEIVDRFLNTTAAGIVLPRHGLVVGPMHNVSSKAATQGITYLGLDVLPQEAGKDVKHWGKELNKFFGAKSSPLSCGRIDGRLLPMQASQNTAAPVAWLAAKNKFFVQILAPAEPAMDGELRAYRDPAKVEELQIESVAGSLIFAERELAPGMAYERAASLYAGPKEFQRLNALGNRKSQVMQFGWWDWYRSLCQLLLNTLNWLYGIIPNYGVAIILLTVIVRVIFWPVTHKSTVHMKRMQQLQPLLTEIRKQHKDNPQKMNQAVMALYKEHKVNPMAGCLPMVVQIPVFIALFTVLRSAVELRFAGFLWIPDLSEPEGLLAEKLGFPINILPLLMTATTILQQRLTPTAGDPQQQKIMMFMPVIFLFLFYSMPSALVLYWTTSQALAILQLVLQRRGGKDALKLAPAPAAAAGMKPMATGPGRSRKAPKRR